MKSSTTSFAVLVTIITSVQVGNVSAKPLPTHPSRSHVARRAQSNDTRPRAKLHIAPRVQFVSLGDDAMARPSQSFTHLTIDTVASSQPPLDTLDNPTLRSSSTEELTSELGLIAITSKSCGPSGATKAVTPLSGPNGSIGFLNCGITGAGWTPPFLTLSDIIFKDFSTALRDPATAFRPCAPYASLFETNAERYGVPAILLASFAMQESTCNSSAVGGSGEQGLMQLSQDKCLDAPMGNCQDPNYNVRTGAMFFAQTLNESRGDLLVSIGQYNGWRRNMSFAEATAAANTDDCEAQNNLDYLHQFLNGWCQNVDPYDHRPPLGKFFNFEMCNNRTSGEGTSSH